MPELPEVETIRRRLYPQLMSRTITGIVLHWHRTLVTSRDRIMSELPGSVITDVRRRGKYLWFSLSTGRHLFIHLKMSGRLVVVPHNDPDSRHIRSIISLDRSEELRFADTRKFGRIYYVDDPNEVIGSLGPEPLSPEFTRIACRDLFRQRRGRLKSLLLNQEFIAGLGNIYTDESCFIAGLDPRRTADTLTDSEINKLYRAIRQVLRNGIAHQGASLDWVYEGGKFQNYFAVYGRKGEPCRKCHRLVERIVLGGRSTHFCSSCQR